VVLPAATVLASLVIRNVTLQYCEAFFFACTVQHRLYGWCQGEGTWL